ncbi:MAG: alpha/beta hydrolase [Acidobacteriota bacterium]
MPTPRTAISTDGTPIRFELGGCGDVALVFVHCWNGERSFWRETLAAFSEHHTVVAFDLAGHGESGRNRKTWSIAAYADDLRAVVELVPSPRLVLIGHSMGAYVALEAALALGTRVLGLVPVDSLLDVASRRSPARIESDLLPWRRDYARSVELFTRAWLFADSTPPAVIERVVALARNADPTIAIESIADCWGYDAAAAFAQLRIPIHAINADNHPTDLPGNRRFAPQFKVTLMNGVGHYPMLEDPPRFNALLANLLRDVLYPAGGD